MYKVMIVDDEQIVREGIKFSLENHYKDRLKVVCMARNGRDAISNFEDYHPDIVLMDIQMPGLNGIESIRQILEMNKSVKFVIISAYEQFEYAKEALKMGVSDYITKPIEEQNLFSVIDSVIAEVNKDKRNKELRVTLQEKLDNMGPALESGFIYSMLLDIDPLKGNKYFQEAFSFDDYEGYVMIVELIDFDEVMLEKSHTMNQSIRNIIKYKCQAIVGPVMMNRLIIIVKDNSDWDIYKARLKAIDLADSISRSIKTLLKCDLKIGIGSRYEISDIRSSYFEARRVINQVDHEVGHIEDMMKVSKDKRLSLSQIKSDQLKLVELVEENAMDEVKKAIEGFYRNLFNAYGDQENIIRQVLMELMVLLNMMVHRNDLSDRVSVSYFDQNKDIIEMKHYVCDKALKINELLNMEKVIKASNDILEAVAYIESNYKEDIRLKDVAAYVNISPHYFSKIFKDELGINFSDYITNYRINLAKVMLKEKKDSIKSIAYSVGYNDPNYFSRIFKKVVGVSPKEFQE
ncbi:response regulator [Acidaminobacter sp. JC074]|uniref:response regulator n=1 Tax=Acidaminobacter sp. JC074 TaxID=2530199 RepID=UPI001F111064|nr:response regulator [Acidaminobacter sp. JC074]